MCTLGSVREAVTIGYGEPKRARCRKRRIQPRGYLRTDRGFLYSETPCRTYPAAICGVLRSVATSSHNAFYVDSGRELPRSAAAFCRSFSGGGLPSRPPPVAPAVCEPALHFDQF